MPSDPELDAALLASIGPRWTKVARVLACAAELPSLGFEAGEEDYDVLAVRLGELVASGAVLARGDLNHWRLSEVRRPVLDLEEVERELRQMMDSLKGGGEGPNVRDRSNLAIDTDVLSAGFRPPTVRRSFLR
jgi:hypothetical protein